MCSNTSAWASCKHKRKRILLLQVLFACKQLPSYWHVSQVVWYRTGAPQWIICLCDHLGSWTIRGFFSFLFRNEQSYGLMPSCRRHQQTDDCCYVWMLIWGLSQNTRSVICNEWNFSSCFQSQEGSRLRACTWPGVSCSIIMDEGRTKAHEQVCLPLLQWKLPERCKVKGGSRPWSWPHCFLAHIEMKHRYMEHVGGYSSSPQGRQASESQRAEQKELGGAHADHSIAHGILHRSSALASDHLHSQPRPTSVSAPQLMLLLFSG